MTRAWQREPEPSIFPIAEEIAISCAAFFKVTVTQMRSPTRARPIVDARQAAMYLMRHEGHLRLKEIGLYFSRDYTSVISAIKRINGYVCSYDRDVLAGLAEIRKAWVEKDVEKGVDNS